MVALLALVATRLDVPRFRFGRAPRPAGRRCGAVAIAAVAIAGGARASTCRAARSATRSTPRTSRTRSAAGSRPPHFVIHYAQTPDIEEDIGLVAADHEFRYAQVVAQLGVAPAGKIALVLLRDRDQKARWMGARDVEMAKPWRREIYLEHRAFPHGSLRHEIAHAVASEFGDPLFGVAARRVLGVPVFISPGLIEGLAVAVDWPGGYDRLTPHEAVRAMQVMGKQPTIAHAAVAAVLLGVVGDAATRRPARSCASCSTRYGAPSAARAVRQRRRLRARRTASRCARSRASGAR